MKGFLNDQRVRKLTSRREKIYGGADAAATQMGRQGTGISPTFSAKPAAESDGLRRSMRAKREIPASRAARAYVRCDAIINTA